MISLIDWRRKEPRQVQQTCDDRLEGDSDGGETGVAGGDCAARRLERHGGD